MTSIVLDSEALKPLVAEVVRQTIVESKHLTDSDQPRLAWREDEAAALHWNATLSTA